MGRALVEEDEDEDEDVQLAMSETEGRELHQPLDPVRHAPDPRMLRTHTQPVAAFTRIRLRSALLTPVALLRFRRLYRYARRSPAFIRGSVALAGPRTLLNVSVWADRAEMLMWSGGDEHVAAVRWSYRIASEVWSAYWALDHMSASAFLWGGEVCLPLERSRE